MCFIFSISTYLCLSSPLSLLTFSFDIPYCRLKTSYLFYKRPVYDLNYHPTHSLPSHPLFPSTPTACPYPSIPFSKVMRVLRDNRDSVMAMLEAFVYDPLISWRLLTRRENETALDATVPLGRATGTVLSVCLSSQLLTIAMLCSGYYIPCHTLQELKLPEDNI
jgi:hypothetical protein